VAKSRSDMDENGEAEREGGDEEEDEEQEEEMVVVVVVVVDGSGRIDVGNAVDSHGLSGIDVMTTLGTWYCSCKILNARCREARSSSLVSVKTLKETSFIIKLKMVVERENALYFKPIGSYDSGQW
jgi:hypothetical protein